MGHEERFLVNGSIRVSNRRAAERIKMMKREEIDRTSIVYPAQTECCMRRDDVAVAGVNKLSPIVPNSTLRKREVAGAGDFENEV